MCGGVTIGLAGLKFSGSPSRSGDSRARAARVAVKIVAPRRSLYV